MMQFLWLLLIFVYLTPTLANPLFTSTYINQATAPLHPLYIPHMLNQMMLADPTGGQGLGQAPGGAPPDQAYGGAMGGMMSQLSLLFGGIFQLPQAPQAGPDFMGTFG